MRRPHELWRRAHIVLSRKGDEHDRAEVITVLKRAVDFRIKHLNDRYRFKRIPISEKPAELLAQMEFFGLIRPIMVQKLMQIRNRIEHMDAPPPPDGECSEMVEFVWYFLKSTDRIAEMFPEGIIFSEKGDDDDGVWLSSSAVEWRISVRGWLPNKLVSYSAMPDWIVAPVERMETWDELAARLKSEEAPLEYFPRHRARDTIYVSTDSLPPQSRLVEFVRAHFAAV